MDAFGHLNNAAIVTLLEEGRVRFVTALGADSQHLGVSLVAARHEIDYLRPISYAAEPVDVHTWIRRIGTSSFTVGAQIDVGGTTSVRAATVVVAVIPESGKPIALPDEARAALAPYLRAADLRDG